MSGIDSTIIEETANMIRGQLYDYQKKIDTAYCGVEGAFTVSLSVKFEPRGSGIKIDTSISFTPEKIKDKASKLIDPSAPRQKDALPFTFASEKEQRYDPLIEAQIRAKEIEETESLVGAGNEM